MYDTRKLFEPVRKSINTARKKMIAVRNFFLKNKLPAQVSFWVFLGLICKIEYGDLENVEFIGLYLSLFEDKVDFNLLNSKQFKPNLS